MEKEESETQLLGVEGSDPVVVEAAATFAPKQDCFWLLLVNMHPSKGESAISRLLNIANTSVAYFTNVFLQIAITGMMLLGAERLEQPVQAATFIKNHNMTLVQAAVELNKAVDAQSNETLGHAFTRDHGILERCIPQLGVRYPCVYHILVLTWLLTMLPEFRTIITDVRALMSMATRPPPTANAQIERLKSDPGMEPRRIVELTPWQRAVITFSVPIMRGAVAIVVTYSGAKFLMLQTSMLTMVTKSLCMKFVVGMDDTIYQALVSPEVRKDISLMRLVTYRTASKSQFSMLWDEGLGGLTLFALAGVAIFVLTEITFGGLMDFRAACWSYHEAFPGVLHEHTIGFDKLFVALVQSEPS